MSSPFKEAFCHYVHCTPGSYMREMLFRCLHPNARSFARIINWLEPAAMFQFLDEIGETTSQEIFHEVLSEYQYRQKLRGGFLANRLNIRLAIHLLEKLHEEVRRAEAN